MSVALAVDDENEGSKMAAMVALQAFDGSFELTESLVGLIGRPSITLTSLREARSAQSVLRMHPDVLADRIWATALALAVMRGDLGSSEDELQLLAAKAVSWLRAQLQPPAIVAPSESSPADQVMEAAIQLLLRTLA